MPFPQRGHVTITFNELARLSDMESDSDEGDGIVLWGWERCISQLVLSWLCAFPCLTHTANIIRGMLQFGEPNLLCLCHMP